MSELRSNSIFDPLALRHQPCHPRASGDPDHVDWPSSGDLQQIVAYAVAKNCTRAVLLYPVIPEKQFNQCYGHSTIEVTTTSV